MPSSASSKSSEKSNVTRTKHVNTAFCPACAVKLLGVDSRLVTFAQNFRALHPEGHISCGFRGEAEQNEVFKKHASNARWLESPHNFGLALDWFRLTVNGAEFDRTWYMDRLGPAALAAGLVWGATFKKLLDFPHVEIKDWQLEVASKLPSQTSP